MNPTEETADWNHTVHSRLLAVNLAERSLSGISHACRMRWKVYSNNATASGARILSVSFSDNAAGVLARRVRYPRSNDVLRNSAQCDVSEFSNANIRASLDGCLNRDFESYFDPGEIEIQDALIG